MIAEQKETRSFEQTDPRIQQRATHLHETLATSWGISTPTQSVFPESQIANPTINDFVKVISASKLLTRALDGQVRKNVERDPAATHSFDVAQLVADAYIARGLQPERDTIIASLLHDVPEDTRDLEPENQVPEEYISAHFGKNVADMVHNLTIVRDINKKEVTEETHMQIFESLLSNPRTILIKLADRLHNMRTIDALKREKQLEKASETLSVYVPLARHLGLGEWADELAEHSLKIQNPAKFDQLKERMTEILNHNGESELNNDFSKFLIHSSIVDPNNSLDGISVRKPSVYQLYKDNDFSFEDIYDAQIRHIVTFVVNKTTNYSLSQEENDRKWGSDALAHFANLHDSGQYYFPQGSMNYLRYGLQNYIPVTIAGFRLGDNTPFSIRFVTSRQDEVEHTTLFDYITQGSPKNSLATEKIQRLRQNLLRAKALGNTKNATAEFTSNLETDFITIRSNVGNEVTIPQGTLLDAAYSLRTDIAEHISPDTRIMRNNKEITNPPFVTRIQEGDQLFIETAPTIRPTIAVDWLDAITTSYARDKITKKLRTIIDVERKKRGNGRKEYTEDAVTRGIEVIEQLFSELSARRGLQDRKLSVGIDQAKPIWQNHHAMHAGQEYYPPAPKKNKSQRDFLTHVGIDEISRYGYGRQLLNEVVNHLINIQNNLVPIHIVAANIPGASAAINEAFRNANVNIETGDIWPYQRAEGMSRLVYFVSQDSRDNFNNKILPRLHTLIIDGVPVVQNAHIHEVSKQEDKKE